MNIIQTVELNGFWGDRDLEISFHKDVNFFIGNNGSGKTTLINIIAAALSADLATLDRLPFTQLVVRLVDTSTKKKSQLTISKKQRRGLPFSGIEYEIKEASKMASKTYQLDEIEEQFALRSSNWARRLRQQTLLFNEGLSEHLRSLVNVSWLSIHRSTLKRSPDDDNSYESTVDKKLDTMSNNLVRYFSILSGASAKLYQEFEEGIFLSLLEGGNWEKAFSEIKKYDLKSEEDDLRSIFERFKVNSRRYEQKLTKHFETVRSFLMNQKKTASNQGISISDVVSILSTQRIHDVVQKWGELQTQQKQIYGPRDTFLDVLNNMIQRKVLKINEKNEISAHTDSNKTLALKDLSSGEKQLFIILGEALLQEGKPNVYIADEPELSLHVKWQHQIIDNLLRINPNSQIIVATHSPDIVGKYQEKIFNMEKII